MFLARKFENAPKSPARTMIRFFSDLTKSISEKRREQIERRKAELRQRFSSKTIHRLADEKLYKLTVDGWVEVQPRLDSDRA